MVDSCIISASFFLALGVRLGEISIFISKEIIFTVIATTVITLIAFTKLGLYRAVLRYLTFHALAIVILGALVSTLSIPLFAYYFDAEIPRTVPVIYLTFLALLCGGIRIIIRSLVAQTNSKTYKNVLIYGAGGTGRQLSIALRSSENYRVKGFIDDDRSLDNTIIQGLTVHPSSKIEKIVERDKIDKILLAIPKASRSTRKTIIDSLLYLQREVLTIPNLKDILEGKAKIDELKDVAIEDLLDREPVEPDSILMKANIQDKTVMVTGAGGSIGSELCRQIVIQNPKTLILFEISEPSLYQLDKELSELIDKLKLNVNIIPLLGSVRHTKHLSKVMCSFNVQTVYHAAAYKHVPLVEYNVIEGIQNNVFGSYYSAKAAIEANAELFVLISTDKAVRPTSIMGASKRMAELVLQALAEQEKTKPRSTRFCMVRFGNVLDSSGSVIPLFKKQIAEGKAITVTHPEIIRYFMTIPEASQLVIQAGAMSSGGDVFVLDMGEPVKILDLAKNLIQLSGLEIKSSKNPNGDIEIHFTGLRPGEKLYEELLIGSNTQGTKHKRIMTANEHFLSLERFNNILKKLNQACLKFDYETIQKILLEIPIELNSTGVINDLLWDTEKDASSPKSKIIDLNTRQISR
jgi:FlaA1/EpsC-like NDP-sugar epimerase